MVKRTFLSTLLGIKLKTIKTLPSAARIFFMVDTGSKKQSHKASILASGVATICFEMDKWSQIGKVKTQYSIIES